ncbi:hypothetical protein P175DRAFT_0529763 [Aspergillus ochraceoroseus IBT 24754]|uniref:Uncharacterized protein n=1 Tax=Aspergillus ochraceoroseus IBT 24754 TaxID=1392256 RepID=A0A2T5M2D8_9EURO|nr:uncharacterized protein P175DRAFT_0529763 [Aspergillus ochraceoroseus IBT 24754]PTU22688.1 hypothetical protein P175DRAFT_0529763 [Aspergillus ochraceoroseus IBT 24754]
MSTGQRPFPYPGTLPGYRSWPNIHLLESWVHSTSQILPSKPVSIPMLLLLSWHFSLSSVDRNSRNQISKPPPDFQTSGRFKIFPSYDLYAQNRDTDNRPQSRAEPPRIDTEIAYTAGWDRVRPALPYNSEKSTTAFGSRGCLCLLSRGCFSN